ncbi:MAG: PEP-utilizing enzyme [Gemmatimonadota bacterium]|nr:PEP-utilizing enzyme [Gemmatimonadota bacterium]
MAETTEIVVDLARASCASLDQVGGKARNLGRLLAGGFRVPDGFCVTADACARFLEYNGLDPAGATEETVARGSFPEYVERAIRTSSELLLRQGAGPVAVRSSGASEDGSAFAFAGQFETYLNLTDVASVLQHVRMCWASAWNDRLRTYAPDVIPRIAVVVQEMVDAEKSGIVFTQNPVASGAPGIFVEANWGLGETVVGGEVSPDSYVLDRKTGNVVEKHIAEKLWRLRPGDRRAEPMPEGLRRAEALSPDELRMLWRQGRKIEAFSGGRPQDIEWAFSGGRLYLLQTRPITTTVSRPRGTWSRGICDDLWSEALCPMAASIIAGRLSEAYTFQRAARRLGLRALIRDDMMNVIDGYMYVNADAVSQVLRLIPERLTADDALKILPRSLRDEVKDSPRSWWRIVPALLRLPGLLMTEPYGLIHSNHRRVRQAFFPVFCRRIHAIERQISSARAPDALLGAANRLTELAMRQQRDVNQWSYAFAMNCIWALRTMVVRWADLDMEVFKDLLLVPARNKTSEANAALEELTEEVRNDPGLRRILETGEDGAFLRRMTAGEGRFASRFEAFIQGYGERAANRDFTYARWRERPEIVVQMLRQNLCAESVPLRKEPRETMQAAESKVFERLSETPFGSVRVVVFRHVLRYARIYIGLREELRFHLDRLFAGYRSVFLGLADHLVSRGLLRRKDDVFFLTCGEVENAFRGGPAPSEDEILRRIADFERARIRQPFYFWIDGRGENPVVDEDQDAHRLQGVGTSPGTATGFARLIRGPEAFGTLGQGEVLVALGTDPGWTPLFRRASAVVTEIGGVLNHSSVIAREYRVPAVVGVSGATRRIRTGDRVTVDGSRGVVEIFVDGGGSH